MDGAESSPSASSNGVVGAHLPSATSLEKSRVNLLISTPLSPYALSIIQIPLEDHKLRFLQLVQQLGITQRQLPIRILRRPEIRPAACTERRRDGNREPEYARLHMTGPAFAEGFQGREIRGRDVGCVLQEEGFVFEGFDGPAGGTL